MSKRQKKKRLTAASIGSEGKKSNGKDDGLFVDNTDRKDVLKKELLNSLLSCIVIKSEVAKGFSRLRFRNSNSYTGWLGPDGFEGFGTYTYADGTLYRGSFKGSLTRGMGKYEYKNDSIYQGEFLAGCRHGYGQYRTKHFRYDGYFENGLFHGEGAWKAKAREQKGVFRNGKIIHGEVHDSSGIFKGSFDESAQRKQGKLTFTNGHTYEGSWLEDLFHGFGVYNWVEEGSNCTMTETKYVGYWSKGKRHALGKLEFLNRIIICQWFNDKKIGGGVIFACNGRCYAGMDMFNEYSQYVGSNRIKLCKESNDILSEITALINSDQMYDTMEEKSDALKEKIKKLVESYTDSYAPFYPIHVPHYEIVDLPPGPHCTDIELRYVQQVASENYKDFQDLYQKYTHPTDELMNRLGLNLFYMDVFSKVQDVNIAKCLNANCREIRLQWLCLQENVCTSPLIPIPFYEFFQHFLRISEILMKNENLKLAAVELRPTFFGHLATHVLLVLKLLKTKEVFTFLVREGIQVNRPAMLAILHSMEEQSPGDKSLRSAYRFLHMKNVANGKSFTKVVGDFFPSKLIDCNLRDTDSVISDLELIEIVLRTCELKLFHDTIKQGVK